MRRLEGRVAVVTGAASGIGRATAERLASERAVAVVTDVQDEAGEQAAAALRDAGGEALYVRLDVTDEASWQAAVERVLAERGRLDVLVNNAGMGDLATIEETSLSDWEETIRSRSQPPGVSRSTNTSAVSRATPTDRSASGPG